MKEQLAVGFCNREDLSWENEYTQEAYIAGWGEKTLQIKYAIMDLEKQKSAAFSGGIFTPRFNDQQEQRKYVEKLDYALKILKQLL